MSTQGGTNLVDDIGKVTHLIELCLVRYMNEMQVIETLYKQEKIEPIFTKIVWQILEVQNQEFFKEYYLRLTLSEQIAKFNDLLEKQAAMMNQLNRNEVAMSKGSRIQTMHHTVSATLQSRNDFNNCGLYIDSGMQHALDDLVAKLLAQNPNDGMNALPVNNEFGYSEDVMESLTDYPYGLSFGNMDSNLRPTIDYPSGSSLSNLDSNSRPTSDNASISSFGQMDSNTYKLDNTLSDDMSPLLSHYPDNLLDSSNGTTIDNQGKIHVSGENTKLTNISRNMDF